MTKRVAAVVAAVALVAAVPASVASESSPAEHADAHAGAVRSCPDGARLPALDLTDMPRVAAEQSRLLPMFQTVGSYGEKHDGSFASTGLWWVGSADASVFVALSRDIGAHAAALKELVQFPDELFVCKALMSRDESTALLQELAPQLAGRARGWRTAVDGVIEVTLLEIDEPFAAELLARYGERVRVTVGLFPYPMPNPLPPSVCRDLSVAQPIAGLRITIDPLAEPLRPRPVQDPQYAVLRIRNVSARTVSFDTGTSDA